MGREEDLREEAIPEVEGEVGIGAADARDHVIFKCAYGTFTCVASVAPRRRQLEVDALVLHEGDQGSAGLVIQSLELRAKAAGAEELVGALICELDLVAGSGGHGLDVNVAAVVIVQQEYVSVS